MTEDEEKGQKPQSTTDPGAECSKEDFMYSWAKCLWKQ